MEARWTEGWGRGMTLNSVSFAEAVSNIHRVSRFLMGDYGNPRGGLDSFNRRCTLAFSGTTAWSFVKQHLFYITHFSIRDVTTFTFARNTPTADAAYFLVINPEGNIASRAAATPFARIVTTMFNRFFTFQGNELQIVNEILGIGCILTRESIG